MGARGKFVTLLLASALALVAAGCASAPSGTASAARTAPAADVEALIREAGLIEAPEPAARRASWRSPRLVVVPRVPAERLAELQAAAPGVRLVMADTVEEVAAAVPRADAAIGLTKVVCDPAVLAAGSQLRWLQALGSGIEPCRHTGQTLAQRDILLTNMQRVGGPFLAEHALAMLFALTHGLQLWIPRQAAGEWNKSLAGSRLTDLPGKTLLVAGLGGNGTEVARRAHALGLRVIATRASSRTAPDFVDYVGLPEELNTLAAQADFVIGTLPGTPATTGVFDARFFAALKPGGYFINIGRGSNVVTDDLVAALASGRLAGAGLDVIEPEPLPRDHPLWQAQNLILTPHIAGTSDPVESARFPLYRENLRRYAAGERMLSVADPLRGY
jgi:phosphoglycerate dehydrogenase-like enzyme